MPNAQNPRDTVKFFGHIVGTGCNPGMGDYWRFEHRARAVLFYDARTNPNTPITACPRCCDIILEKDGIEKLREQLINDY